MHSLNVVTDKDSKSLTGSPRQIRGLEMMMSSNYNDLSLYLVAGLEVTSANAETEWDGSYSILVAATSAEAALQVAYAYDKGRVQADNLVWLGKTISVVTLRDKDTGLFA